MLPFDRDQFVAVFAAYNNTIWPVQIVAVALGLAMVILLFRNGVSHGRPIAFGLAAMWLWTGIAYHAIFFAAINPAAYLFAAFFAVEALLIAIHGASRVGMSFAPPRGIAGWVGIGLVAYSLLLYPLIGWLADGVTELPMFGVTPCPVTLFTFGLFLLARPPMPVRLLVIPAIWSLIGGSAAILLAIPQDWPLLASGFVAVPLIMLRNRAERSGSSRATVA